MPQATFKTIDSIDVAGKRVLVRVDLNVPMKNGQVTDATRIERAVPTLAELAAKGAKVIVLSHFGRPDGKRGPEMSLKRAVRPLAELAAKGAKVIVPSHFGRPDGKRVPEMSLKPLVEPLSEALGK